MQVKRQKKSVIRIGELCEKRKTREKIYTCGKKNCVTGKRVVCEKRARSEKRSEKKKKKRLGKKKVP